MDTDDDDIYQAPEESEEEKKLREQIEGLLADGDEEDDAGLDSSFEEEPDVEVFVTEKEGQKAVEQAKFEAPAPTADKKSEAAPEEKPQDATPADAGQEGKVPGEEGAATGDADPVDLAKASVADLLKGAPQAHQSEISRRLSESERVLAPFKGREAELQMHGQTPESAVGRLLELNAFAQTKPDEYLAWVAQQVKPSEAHSVLEGAAKLLGYKLVQEAPEADDDDEFVDPEVKRLRQENAELKRQGQARQFGPDTPERQAVRSTQQTLNEFIHERDETGNLRRPLFDQLRPQITEKARAHRASTNQAVTVDDLHRFYDETVQQFRQAIGVPDTSAAQPQSVVPEQKHQAAVEKSKRASTSIDGDGQGASRRPAPSPDADLADVIRHFASLE